jgi:hypothetical protein
VADPIGARFTASLGIGPGLSAGDAARAVRALRKRHEAVCGLIAALEAARAAGCDLRFFQCLGCDLLHAAGAARRRA